MNVKNMKQLIWVIPFLAVLAGLATAVLRTPLLQATEQTIIYLSFVANLPPTPTPTPSPTPTSSPTPTPTSTPTPSPTPVQLPLPQIANPSFEDGWTDLPPEPGYLINQQPNSWLLSWVPVGQPLYDDPSSLSGGVPECKHILWWQLPPNEQPGGEDALILDGLTTYKMFHATAPFGSELRQTITNLVPGSSWRLVVPIQVHLYGDTDPYTAESGVWVNGVGGWANAGVMGDRNWYEHGVLFTVPANGQIEIVIRVKSKWDGKGFFIDALRMERP